MNIQITHTYVYTDLAYIRTYIRTYIHAYVHAYIDIVFIIYLLMSTRLEREKETFNC